MWEAELKDVLWNFIKIAGFAPIAGYFYMYFIDAAGKAWKSGSRKRKWIVCSCLFVVSAVVLRYLNKVVF